MKFTFIFLSKKPLVYIYKNKNNIIIYDELSQFNKLQILAKCIITFFNIYNIFHLINIYILFYLILIDKIIQFKIW